MALPLYGTGTTCTGAAAMAAQSPQLVAVGPARAFGVTGLHSRAIEGPQPIPVSKGGLAVTHVAVTVNGTQREADVEPRTLLVYFLRETLGLTGTNVGCDTSSCGACTVLLDGESVKSCTLLAVQADGREVTTIEGARRRDGELHPLQDAFHRNHGLQCGFCTPGMIMAAASYLKENPTPDGRGRSRVPRGQPLPLHRLPEHREVDPRRRRVDERREGLRRSTWRPPSCTSERQVLRKEDPELVTGQANFIDNHVLPGMVWMAMVRPPYVHATINSIDTSGGEVDARRRRRLHGGRPRGSAALPFVWPITEDIKIPVHYPLTKDKIRFHGDAVAVVVAETREQALDAAENVTVDVTELPAVDTTGGRHGRRRAADPRGARLQRHRPLEPRRRRRSGHLRVGTRRRAGALPPAPADPQRDRAARLPRVRRSRRWASSRCGAPRRSRTSRRSRCPASAASPRRSCASSRRTSAAASAPS